MLEVQKTVSYAYNTVSGANEGSPLEAALMKKRPSLVSAWQHRSKTTERVYEENNDSNEDKSHTGLVCDWSTGNG